MLEHSKKWIPDRAKVAHVLRQAIKFKRIRKKQAEEQPLALLIQFNNRILATIKVLSLTKATRLPVTQIIQEEITWRDWRVEFHTKKFLHSKVRS